jgi:hypothetical protein
MSDPLEEAKGRLFRYLGTSGVHGVGLRRSENAVCVYLDARLPGHEELLREMEREILPVRLIAVYEAPPSLT